LPQKLLLNIFYLLISFIICCHLSKNQYHFRVTSKTIYLCKF
jgi:hypothetical protein